MKNKTPENNNRKKAANHNADSGNEITNEILQYENLIDPGNEHHHHADDEKKSDENKEAGLDAEEGDDKPATQNNKTE